LHIFLIFDYLSTGRPAVTGSWGSLNSESLRPLLVMSLMLLTYITSLRWVRHLGVDRNCVNDDECCYKVMLLVSSTE